MNYDLIKLCNWIDKDKIDWENLSRNRNAMHILEQIPNNIHWDRLSGNPNAMHILEQNLDKVDWIFYQEIQMRYIY